jgi:hypothetical protein
MLLYAISFSPVSLSYISHLYKISIFKIYKKHRIHILNVDIVYKYDIYDNETGLNVIADKNIGREVKVVYEPPEDGHIKAETYVGVAE